MPWKFTYEGEVYQEADLTLGDIDELCNTTGLTWNYVTYPLASPSNAWQILAGLHSKRTGRTIDEITAALKAMPVREFVKLYDNVEQDDLPTEYADGFPPSADEQPTGS